MSPGFETYDEAKEERLAKEALSALGVNPETLDELTLDERRELAQELADRIQDELGQPRFDLADGELLNKTWRMVLARFEEAYVRNGSIDFDDLQTLLDGTGLPLGFVREWLVQQVHVNDSGSYRSAMLGFAAGYNYAIARTEKLRRQASNNRRKDEANG